MLNQKYRFHSRGGVRHVYKDGKTIRSPKISLIYCKNPRKFTRVSVVVSKKVSKSAVVRNRIRRRIYECVRINFEDLPKNHDYLFVVYDVSIAKIPFKDLTNILAGLVSRIK